MNDSERDIFEHVKQAFQRVMTSSKLSSADQSELVSHTTELLGFFTINNDPELRALIEKMMDFAESKNLSMLSQRMAFEYVLQKHLSRRP